MKARNIIPDWPRGTSTSKPYESNRLFIVMHFRHWELCDLAMLEDEVDSDRRYHEGQARMMDEWRRTGGVKWPSQHIPYPRTSYKLEGLNVEPSSAGDVTLENIQKAYEEAKFGAEADVPDEYYFDGRHYYEPLEDHIAPTYGGITRGDFGDMTTPTTAANYPASDAGNITLDTLLKQMDALPKFPKMPAYYRCHPTTYANMTRTLCNKPDRPDWLPEWINFAGVRIVQDPKVTPGEFWPPEDEEKPE